MTWRRHGLTAVTAIGPPVAVAAAALFLESEYDGAAQVAEWLIALVAAVVSIRSRTPAVKWGALAAFLACLQASVVGIFQFGTASWVVTLLAAAGCLAARLTHLHRLRAGSLDRSLKRVRLETAHVRAQIAHARLDRLHEPPEPEPDLVGRNQTETALRQAVWATHRSELDGCDAFPTSFGWEARLQLPPPLERGRVARDWQRVASALGVPGSFELSDGTLSNELVVRYLEADPLAEPVPYRAQATEDQPASFRDPVRLGRDGFATECRLDLAYNHTLIAGSSKFGKSGLVKLLAFRLAERPDCALIGVDMKPGAPELSGLRPLLQDLAQTVEQARALFAWLTSEMEERGRILAEHGETLWDPQRHGRPALYVIVDELAELTRQGDQVERGQVRVSQLLESQLALARGYAMHLILATQQPSNHVFGRRTDARGNLANRLCVRMNDPRHGQFVFGSAAWRPSELDLPGKFLVQSPDHAAPWVYRAEWVTDEVTQTEVTRLGRYRAVPPAGNRLILPADVRLDNRERVLDRLRQYGPMQRRELEAACLLDERQVLRALNGAKPAVTRDEASGLWLLSEDSRQGT